MSGSGRAGAAVIAGFALGCSGPEVEPRGETVVNVVTHVNVVTTPTTTTTTITKPVDDPCLSKTPGIICTYAGIPHVGQFSPDGLPRTESALYFPIDLTFSPLDGRPYIVDFVNHRIRTVLPDETVVTVAGTGFFGDGISDDQTYLWHDGPALDFSFDFPSNLAFDPLDPEYMYIAAWRNSRVDRYVAGTVEYFAGTGGQSYGDGDPDGDGVFLASDAVFNLVASVTFDDAGVLYVSDQDNVLIRRIERDGTISDFAGTRGSLGFAGDGGPASLAKFAVNPSSATDPELRAVYHDGALYVADTENQVIRKIDLATDIITTVAGSYVSTGINGVDTDGDGAMNLFLGDPAYAGDGGPATLARLAMPRDVAFGPDGTMYIADTGNGCVRSVAADGTIDTFAGQCATQGGWWDYTLPLGDGGDPLQATLAGPSGVEVDPAGNVYIADQYDQVIRVVWK